MNISYTLTLNQYQEASILHYKQSKRPLFVGLYIGLATFVIISGTDFSNVREVIDNILITFFAIAFYLLFTRMITAYQAKKIYTNHPLLSNEVLVHISGQGISLDKHTKQKVLGWDIFEKYVKSEKHYLLYTNKHQFNVIPRSAMKEDQEEELDKYLEKYLSSEARSLKKD